MSRHWRSEDAGESAGCYTLKHLSLYNEIRLNLLDIALKIYRNIQANS